MLLRRNSWNDQSDLDRDLENQLNFWMNQRNQASSNLASKELASNGPSEAPTLWQPAIDIHEDAEQILLVADLPGLEQSEVDISVENSTLTLRGERKPRVAAEGKGHHHHCERIHGRFSRAFTLPPTVELDGVTAEMKAGVLTVTLPKKQEAKPRQVKINVAST